MPGDDDAIDIHVTITLVEGRAESTGIAFALDFSEWDTADYLMIPAAVYNGNRNRIVRREYASGLDRTDLYRKDLPLTTAELPQLSPGPGGISRIEVNASNVTTPAVCFYDKSRKRAFILLAEQGVELGDTIADNVFIVEESEDRTKMTLAVNAPGVREWKPEFIGFSRSPDRAITWESGDQLTLRLRMYNFIAEDIPALLDRFTSVRKSVTGNNQPRNLMPFSEILRVMTGNIDERFYEGDLFRFYCPENANWISFGWIGGLMNSFPMIALNNESYLERAVSTFDFAIPRAQGASGYFYGALNFDGNCFGREGYAEYPEITLTRKSADVLLWMIKQFRLLEAQKRGKHIKPEWEHNIRRLADAFVNTWKMNGQWGNMINNINGDIAVFNTTSGASAIGGLALAGPVWASTQNKHGTPGFCTSSGDPLVKIYRATGDRRYANLLHDVAHAYTEGIQPNGKITEGLTFCDADHRGSRLTGGKTGWNELNGALMALEIPGIYIRTDSGEMYVFDHIEASVVERSDKSIIMSVNNPTPYPDDVSVFVESYAESQAPMSCISFPDWKRLRVEPGETALYRIDKRSKAMSEIN